MPVETQDWLNTGFEYKNDCEKVLICTTTSENNKECSICISGIECDQKIYSLSCGHIYHEICLKEWLTRQTTCPECRKHLHIDKIVDEDESIIDYQLEIIYNIVTLMNPIIEKTFNFISDIIY